MTAMPAHLRSIVDRDGAVILDINRDQFFSMNPVGSYIWDGLLKGEGLVQIALELAEETGMDISIVMADVNDFVADLKSKQLLQFPQ
jgi:Coenzyme PQQ synthesis protein D (PqqD)